MYVLLICPADYDAYAAQIRQEYIHIPEQLYRTKRAQVGSVGKATYLYKYIEVLVE